MKFAAVVVFCLSLFPVALSHSPQLTNAKRLAQGLPILAPRRLYNPNVARQATPSGIPTGPGSDPSSVIVAATVVATAHPSTTTATRRHLDRRQQIGSTFGYLTQVGHIVTTNTNIEFSFTDDAGDVHGMWYSAYTPSQVGYMGLGNGNSYNSSDNTAVTLSPNTGDFVYIGNCGTDLDQPAGSPPINDPNAVEPLYYGETRVYSIDPDTGVITIHYTNPDSSEVPAFVAVYSCPDFGTETNYFASVTANLQLWLDEVLASLQPGVVADPSACTAYQLDLTVS